MHKQATRELLEKELHFVLSAIDPHKLLSHSAGWYICMDSYPG